MNPDLDNRICADIGCRKPINGQVEYVLQVSTGHVRWFCDVDCVVNGFANHRRALYAEARALRGNLTPTELLGPAYWAEADVIYAERQQQQVRLSAEFHRAAEFRLATEYAAVAGHRDGPHGPLPTHGIPLRYENDGVLEHGGEPDLPSEVLLCPACGHNCTHVDHVWVLSAGGDRLSVSASGEDEDAHLTVPGTLDWSDAPVPSTRRHTIVLGLECEECRVVSGLVFTQSKGATMVEAIRHPVLGPDMEAEMMAGLPDWEP